MNTNVKDKIISIQRERDECFNKWNDSWSEDNQDFMDKESDAKLDELSSEIRDLLVKNFDDLEVDFMMETLTKTGAACCLLYDDAGHWAITGDGFCTVVYDEPVDWSGQFIIKKEKWFDTIREALNNYITKD